MPKCEYKSPICDGKNVRKIQMKSARNSFNGNVINACAGCRSVLNGQFKYAKDGSDVSHNFYTKVEGIVVHVSADKPLTKDTQQALANMIKLVLTKIRKEAING